MRHLLVTNDFPPKIGGIQSYLWELWRRLPPEDVTVLTTGHHDTERFDAEQLFRVVRTREPVLLPNPHLIHRIRSLVAETSSEAVVLDPALPIGMVGPALGVPYAVVLHGAEVAVPGRLPASRQLLGRVVRKASLLIAAGNYPEAEARRAAGSRGPMPPVVQVPPGVDTKRFVPLPAIDRAAWRTRLGLPAGGPLVVSVSRLVPRKGMDTLIDAAAVLCGDHPDLTVAIAGEGRDSGRLERRIRHTNTPVQLLGRVANVDLPNLYAAADVFVLCCRSRWGGLEQEGFGIVFLEAAAAGIASIAGDSGGAADAVVNNETGLVVANPDDPNALAGELRRLLDNPVLASKLGQAARRRAESDFSYEHLAARLGQALEGLATATGPAPDDYRSSEGEIGSAS
ncbi:MAG: glycosyltransferase family 4 protein [Actinomycetota bacterium]|nr:glycosyltransferase family 4 protein [Actinomycetota bacterium]